MPRIHWSRLRTVRVGKPDRGGEHALPHLRLFSLPPARVVHTLDGAARDYACSARRREAALTLGAFAVGHASSLSASRLACGRIFGQGGVRRGSTRCSSVPANRSTIASSATESARKLGADADRRSRSERRRIVGPSGSRTRLPADTGFLTVRRQGLPVAARCCLDRELHIRPRRHRPRLPRARDVHRVAVARDRALGVGDEVEAGAPRSGAGALHGVFPASLAPARSSSLMRDCSFHVRPARSNPTIMCVRCV